MPNVRTSVVIVSWNVREHLRTCLSSIARERSKGAAVEVIVVDNASGDGSAAAAREIFPSATVLAVRQNLGFAAACNLGAARAHGNLLVFMNPDAEVGPGFFSQLSAAYARHPQAAVLGGQLVGDGGGSQPSVRRFPTTWSSCLDALKILRRFPHLAPRYLALDFDYTREQPAQQLMGACFAVPRHAWQQLNGFDDKFFVWFEEVDFCKRAHEAGLACWYVPVVQARHGQGRSFAQLTPIRRHSLFTASLRRYARKHLGLGSWAVVSGMALLGYIPAATAQAVGFCRRADTRVRFSLALAAYALLDIASWYAWQQHPLWGNAVVLGLTVAWVAVAWRNLALGVAWLAVELVIGSQGYLFSLTLGSTVLSFRFMLFTAALSVLLAKLIARRIQLPWRHPLARFYLTALAAMAWGALVAYVRGNSFSNMFLDANGYLYLGIFPLFLTAEPLALEKWAKQLGYPALAWLGVKTLSALYLFSHLTPDALLPFYQWWRQTGFGEITYVAGNVFRIFSQSQVYAALATAAAWGALAAMARPKLRRPDGVLLVWLTATTLVASLSRSFWLGVGMAWVMILLSLGWAKLWQPAWRLVAYSLLLITASAGLFLATTRLAWPLPPIGASEARVLADRLRGEAASASRLRLLPPLVQAIATQPLAGSGWGATVTYFSLDPRAVRSSAGGTGLTTTYAFEWGYLDTLLKLGLVAGALFFSFILTACYFVARRSPELGLALMALLVINTTTPYLNHPLGLGAIMVAVALVGSAKPKTRFMNLWQP